MTARTLSDWLSWIKSNHHCSMDLSLERVKEVGSRLDVLNPTCPVIIVGGTNGKGSCVRGLESIYLEREYRVGSFTTPYLFKPNEQIKIQGEPVSDEAFCCSYEKIEKVRAEITLTSFEFTALAALDIFKKNKLDCWLLEVGLGGKWDATNCVDADLAIISSIGLDHTEWLGDTREAIAREKAGIFRKGQQVVCGEIDPPQTLLKEAKRLNVALYRQSVDFQYEENKVDWVWKSKTKTLSNLNKPKLAFQNMASVLMAIELLQSKLPVHEGAIRKGISKATLPGRLQVIPGIVPHVVDVSHNPAAAEWLSSFLKKNHCEGKTRAIFSMLFDKDMETTLLKMKNEIDEWHIAPLKNERAMSLDKMKEAFNTVFIKPNVYSSIQEAYKNVLTHSVLGDRIVIFGSFRTVAESGLDLKLK